MELLEVVGRQVPALGVLVFVVVVFLNYIAKRDEQIKEAFERRDKLFIDAHKEMIKAMKEIEESCEHTGIASLNALERNTQMLSQIDERLK